MKLVCWLAEAHAGRMFAYPFGEARGGSSFTTLSCLVALASLWRRREKALPLLAEGPLGVCFSGGGAGPLSLWIDASRTMIFVAPSICLLYSMGFATMIARLRSSRSAPVGVSRDGDGFGRGRFRLARPHAGPPLQKRLRPELALGLRTSSGPRSARDSELVCVKSDLGLGFSQRNWTLFRSALYLCNQRIYSPTSPPKALG